MTAYENVIWGLKCLQSSQMHPCKHCAYNESDCCVEDVARDAQKLIEDKTMNCAQGTWLPATYDPLDDAIRPAWDCSLCGAMVHKVTNYCPRCGAKMEREADDPLTIENAIAVLEAHGWKEDKDMSYFLKLFQEGNDSGEGGEAE